VLVIRGKAKLPKLPTLNFEKALRKEGFQLVAGVDEVGRGAWAGPLFAAAVIFPLEAKLPRAINDSKLLTPALRHKLDQKIRSLALAVGVGQAEVAEIDSLGLTAANFLAMSRAVSELSLAPDYLLIDGYAPKGFSGPVKSVIKGDRLSKSIAAASIVAKVARDQLMTELHSQFPAYGFHLHKGYGTKAHSQALAQCGPCHIHRQSFKSISILTGRALPGLSI
jgi:ribonuclease HII